MNEYNTGIDGFVLRMAEPKDSALILQFIKWLAEYEKMLAEVVAIEADITASIFDKHQADVVIGEYRGEPVAFALFYYPYSTFIGGVYLYLEDLFVRPEYRGRGFGKAIFRYLAALALERGYQRMQWWCLDWNTSSVAFYKKLGAVPQDEWTVYRMEPEALRRLANGKV